MEFCYDIRRMDVAMYYPGVVTNVIALPFDQVLQAVPAHACVQYGLYLVFLFAFHEGWWRRGSRASADDRVGSSQGELDNGKDGVQSGKTWWEFQTVCAMSNTSFDWIWAQTAMGELYRRPIGSDISSIDPYQVARL